MLAAIRRKYCSFEDIKIETVEKPTAGDNDVLIKVYATTVNRTDCAALTGKPLIMRLFTGLIKPKRPIPGTDFAGIIESVGKNVQTFKVSDRVFGFDDQGLSAHAEYMVFPDDGAMCKIPDIFSYDQAAASLEGAHYAFNFINKITLKPGDKVLLNGATGAIGSVLLQFLKFHGAYVTAVCSAQHLEQIKKLGADRMYDYTKEDFTTDKMTYDFVLDAVGKSDFGKCKPLLKKGGTYISSALGPMIQNPFLALITKVTGGKRVIFPVPFNIKRSMEFTITLIENRQFTPLIDRNYRLHNIGEAYTYVASGQKIGNVIISFE